MPEHKAATVLVVDDEPQLRELLVDALSGPDLEVHTAGTASEAVRMARRCKPDIVIADLYLGDRTGLDVIDELRADLNDLPAVVITGSGDADSLSLASRCRPVELMTKPLDIDRLRTSIRGALDRQADSQRRNRRTTRLRNWARDVNRQRKAVRQQLDTTCAALTASYRNLSGQLATQRTVLEYQNALLAAQNDDDVFRTLFHTFVTHSGSVFGAAMVCDSNAQLNVIGRFGVPDPDSIGFCEALATPMVDAILIEPRCTLIDAGENREMFAASVRRYLPGLTVLALPLIPAPGELIALVVLYRKGEQPFTEADVTLAEMIATPTAIAVRRND